MHTRFTPALGKLNARRKAHRRQSTWSGGGDRASALDRRAGARSRAGCGRARGLMADTTDAAWTVRKSVGVRGRMSQQIRCHEVTRRAPFMRVQLPNLAQRRTVVRVAEMR